MTRSGLQLVALATRLNKHDASHGYREVQVPCTQGSPNHQSFNYHEPIFVLGASKLMPNETSSASSVYLGPVSACLCSRQGCTFSSEMQYENATRA